MRTRILKPIPGDLYTYIPQPPNHYKTRHLQGFYPKKPINRKDFTMTTMNLDSLNSCLHMIAQHQIDHRRIWLVDPILVLDSESGHFYIHSNLDHLHSRFTLIADNLDIDGIPGWTDIPDATGVYVSNPGEAMKFIQMAYNETILAPGGDTPRAKDRIHHPRLTVKRR
jgi:hypothetical protein